MENHIETIALINSYLNNRLSGKALEDFKTRLKTDAEFRALYKEHLTVLEGIKRYQLKAEIKIAKQHYLRTKWLNYFGLGSLILVITVVCFYFFNTEENVLKSKLNFEADFKQEIKVGFDSIIEVKGKKGTVLRFNPEDLDTASTDSLTIELIELTTKQDLLLANAQTLSKGKWLISGGAFKIAIKQGSKTLNLKEGKTIDVRFPKNTDESNMALFYGKRNKVGDIEWEKTNIVLRQNPFVILFKEGFVIDTTITSRYGGVETFKSIYVVDTLGIVSKGQLKESYPKINLFDKYTDTIKIKQEYVKIIDDKYDCDFNWLRRGKTFKVRNLDSLYYKKEIIVDSILIDLDTNFVSECREIIGEMTKQIKKNELKDSSKISKQDYKKFRKEYLGRSKEVEKIKNKISALTYRTTQLSKLGWINIDKFANDEAKVNVKLDFNINTTYKKLYLVDQKNNTVLNVYDNDIDLPVDRAFYIIAIGAKGKEIYGFKRSVRFSKNGTLDVDFKRIQGSQIKTFLTLPKSDKNIKRKATKVEEKLDAGSNISNSQSQTKPNKKKLALSNTNNLFLSLLKHLKFSKLIPKKILL